MEVLEGVAGGEVDLVKLVREVATANRSHWMHFTPLCQDVHSRILHLLASI